MCVLHPWSNPNAPRMGWVKVLVACFIIRRLVISLTNRIALLQHQSFLNWLMDQWFFIMNGVRIGENSSSTKQELEWVHAEQKRWMSGNCRIPLLSVDTCAKLLSELICKWRSLHWSDNLGKCQTSTFNGMNRLRTTQQKHPPEIVSFNLRNSSFRAFSMWQQIPLCG